MASRFCHLWMSVSFALLLVLPEGGLCLTNVSLVMVPPAVQRGHHASLICKYDLEDEPLYSVKWYRGRHEFYRYSPSEIPATKIFPFQGIHVDLAASNGNTVVLRNVSFNLSGNFSCEVTVDAPSFSTKTVTQQLLVVALPERPPVIETERDHYDPGDILRANCTSSPSKPAVTLSFLLNNIPVGTPDLRHYRVADSLQSSVLSLTMQVFPSHYNNGELVLKCTAHLNSLYRETVEVTLGSKSREPVPERVTSPNGSRRNCHIMTVSQVLLLVIGCYAAR